MAGTPHSRNCRSFKIFCTGRASGTCQQSAGGTDRSLLYSRRNLEIHIRKIRMNPAHNLFPQVFMERFAVIFQKFVGVITCPYGTGVIWCKTCKPHVTGCRSCTCLTCYRHIIQFQTVTGTTLIVDNTFESTCEQISGAFTEDFGCFWFVFQYHIPVLIQNLGIKYRFGVSTTVSDCSVGSSQFQCGNTVGDTTQGSRFSGVIENLTVDYFVIGNFFEPQIFQIRISKSWGHITEALYGNGITGILESITDRHGTAITAVGIFNRAVCILISDGLIHISVCQSKSQIIDSRSVNSQRFESRTRLAVGIGCPVQSKTGSLFTTSSDQSFDISGVLVNDNHRRLWLRSKADSFGKNSFTFTNDGCFIFIHIVLCFFFGVK